MKQKLFRLALSPFLSVFVIGLALAGEAAAATVQAPPPALATTFSQLGDGVICPVINVFFWVLLAVSVIMVLWAAFLYVTSEGDSEKPSQARKMILYAAVGIVIALAAKGVPNIVAEVFGGNNVGSSPLACP